MQTLKGVGLIHVFLFITYEVSPTAIEKLRYDDYNYFYINYTRLHSLGSHYFAVA